MSGTSRGVPVGRDPIWLDPKLPAEVLAPTIPLAAGDVAELTGLTVAAAPSGAGELVLQSVTFAPSSGLATLTVAAGQPGRTYTILMTASRADALVSDYLINLFVAPVLDTDQAPAAPSQGFGAPVSWGVPDNTLLGADGAYLLGADSAYITFD